MKKNGSGASLDALPVFIKCLLIMKFTLLLILALSFQSFGNGYGQDNINLRLEKVHLKRVFKEIESQGAFRFVYKDEILPRNQRVSISVENASLDEVLHQILKNTSLSYRRMSGSLVVITTETANSFITITGKVTDERGEPLAGVNIIEKGTSNGTTTRDVGVFIINTENANATLVFTYNGFTLQEVDLAGRTTINVQLKPSNKSLQEVIVVGYGQQRKSLVTGAISSVKADQLTTVSSTR